MAKKKESNIIDRKIGIGFDKSPDVFSMNILADHVLNLVRHQNFQQIIVPPFLSRGKYFLDASFGEEFGRPVLEVEPGGSSDLVLTPTLFPNVCAMYLSGSPEENPPTVRWVYTSPVLKFQDEVLRPHHEVGIFIFGDDSPLAYAHLINAAVKLGAGLGIENVSAEISGLGSEARRKEYGEVISEHVKSNRSRFCSECASGEAVFSLFSCANEDCRQAAAGAPQLIDFLDEDCRQDLVGVFETMDELGIAYVVNPGPMDSRLHSHIGFRVIAHSGAEPATLGWGGGLGEVIGLHWGENLKAIGFMTTLERLAQFTGASERPVLDQVEVYVVSLGEQAAKRAMRIHEELRGAGITARESMLGNRGIKIQLEEAESYKPNIALIVGQKEAVDDTVILRDVRSGIQEVFTHERIVEEVKKRLGR